MHQKITKAQYDQMVTDMGGLSEVCELHARGHLIEVIAFVTYLDDEEFEGFTVTSGKIDGTLFSNPGLSNVTCIGEGFTYRDDATYYAVTGEVTEALALAWSLFSALEHVDSV